MDEKILEMSLFEEYCFFSNNFLGNIMFKELLYEFYSKDIPMWKKWCDYGKVTRKKITSSDLIENLNKKDILFSYNEKFRNRGIVFFADNSVQINGETEYKSIEDISIKSMRLFVLNELEYEKIDICLTSSVCELIKDLQEILTYEKKEDFFHPIRKEDYRLKEIYLKLVTAVALVNNKMNAKQMIWITDIACELNVSSKCYLQYINELFKLPQLEKIKFIQLTLGELNNQIKLQLIKDIACIINLGSYEYKELKKIKTRMPEIFKIDSELFDTMYILFEKAKEKENG